MEKSASSKNLVHGCRGTIAVNRGRWSRLTGVAFACVLFLAGLLPSIAGAQTLTLDNSIKTFASLSNTTVTMTGRSELRITGTSAPLSGCVVHLNSPDAWLLLTNIRPSVVNSTYLGQVRVNGAVAALNTNCRIVQYGDGAVVIPHGSTFTPLQVFSGSHFTGTSTLLQNYTAYNDSSLGAFANKISSFKLKRGYTATLAQNANGTGVSKNYVAQDGDIEVSVLPEELNDSVSFIRVFPWRWVGKKGIAGNISSGLNVRWWYNWNLDQNSSLDQEYVPIRQTRWWPGLAQNWQTRGANHLLGYNEPDHVDQANMTVSDAIGGWPDLLGTGLRVGSPAPTDGGLSWLYSFMDQADATDQRVDFVAVHYYRSYSSAADPDGATTQFYNFLKGVYDRVQRPLWVTEWNNGANWTSGPDPTHAQQAATVAKMIEMLDNTPFVERYSLYNWVEDVRRVKWDDGSLTAAGVVYRDKVSPISYSQVIPEVPTSPNALYRFENDARDSSGYGHSAVLKGGATFAAGKNGQGVVLSGDAAEKDHVQLSSRIGDSTDFTFGAWVYWDGGANWQRIFDLGSSTNNYMFLTPKSSTGVLRFGIKDGGTEQQLNHTTALSINTWTHVVVTISGSTGKLFVNGALVATNTAMTINPVDLATSANFLGRSQFSADPYFAGKLDDVQFLRYALSDAKVAAMQTNVAPQFTSATISGGAATQGVAFTGNLAGKATDANAGDTITYSKAEGPAWLTVAANGTLSGTPTFDDEGTQEFVVYATDTVGGSTYAVLTITLPSVIGNGTWSADVNGLWSEVAKWTGSFPANGSDSTANFSTLNITSDRIVTLDSSRNIGRLSFGDTSGAESWTLAASSGKTLTLEVASGSPLITVSQNTATILAPLAGTSGMAKNGVGTLVLRGANSLAGTVYVDSGSTSASDGALRLAHPNTAAGFTDVQIRNNNSGSSTLELDGSFGAIETGASVTLSGRSGIVPAIRNLSGNNMLSGGLTIGVGGGNYLIQSDAGTVTLDGAVTSAASGSRTLTFQGAGNITVAGAISNGSATSGISIAKNGTGTLTLSGNNSHTGATTLNGGTLTLTGSGNVGAGAISLAAGTVLNINKTVTLTNALTGAGAINNTGSNTIAGDFSGFMGSYTHNSSVVSTAFNSATATSRNASYMLASAQGSLQGFIAGGSGDYTLELGALNGIAGSLFRGGFTVSGTTTLAVGNLNGADTFAGTIANGTTKTLAFNKVGTGTMTLSGANTYSGATTVSTGTLLVNGSLSTGAVSVANTATLSGSGSIGGAVTVQSGGAFSPGSGVGTLTCNSSVILQAGSMIRLELNKAAGTSDRLVVAGTFARGGTLVVTNLAGTLTGGDSFTLFQAGSLTGSFASMSLPALGAGLNWNTSNLTNGVLSVEYTASTYAGWAGGYSFPAGEETSSADPDGDGMENVMEWLFGTNPLAQNVTATVGENWSGADIPGAAPNKHYLTLTARIRKSYSGVTVVPQVNTSPELLDTPASEGSVNSFSVEDLGEFENRVWWFTQPIEDAPAGRAFMRLKVISN